MRATFVTGAAQPRAAASAAVRSAPWSTEWVAFVWSSVPGALLATATMAGYIPRPIAMAIFAISFVGFNLMHMSATWARVYVRPGWQGFPVERLALPVGLVLFALAYEAVGGGALLLAAMYFLSFHHAIMQNYGLLRVAERRTARRIDARLDLAACLLLPGAALLYRAAMVCDRYSTAPLPAAPLAIIQLLAAAGVVAIAAFGWREWRSYRAGEQVDPIGIGLVFGTNLVWSALLVGNPDPVLPLYALASGHYAQYLYFVWRAEQRDGAQAVGTWIAPRLQSELLASRFRYLLVLLIIGGTVTLLLTFVSSGMRAAAVALDLRPAQALDIPPWAAAVIGVSFEHYWLDRRIWRTRRRPAAALAPASS